ncbi:MAG: RDD family protein [Alphaproteobacteria bacterium]|nr:RDD family protein [Alphaproteobacteria bacterium]MBU1514438.1 RDD family protein [Alphaproteobacteria bacterium]MBU2097081.1 RDD family protein [Alphaproteobacteria bacterium]MBU2153560.1 RDD family protein [Alphaproteobacteria bacterium]MBU2308637.1 RDD family protein [Alphaproteobacteria bacterium]
MRERRATRPPYDGWRELVTPEGVDLRLKIGAYAERFSALLIDFAILFGSLAVFSLICLAVFAGTKASWGNEALGVVWLLGVFVGRNFYFVLFEMGPRAATPGKRAMGLRVAAANGGRLTADMVFARNAMREVEVILPLTFFAARGQGVDAALITLGAIWSCVFILFPLFNRDRRRMGDLVAGTMVVKAPKAMLRPDLADTERGLARGFAFTPAQLDAYGIKELHVLEDVIRAADRKSMAEVATRIRTKIGWEGPADTPDRTFLNAYYAALRGRLESRMLFGHRRKDKFDVS